MRGAVRAVVLAVVTGLLLLPTVTAAARAPLDVQLFARVPSPGAPAGVAVGPDGRIYTASLNADGNGDPKAPSKVFAYSRAGKLLRSYEIQGQDLAQSHGLTGLAFDAEGRLYIGDLAPPRVVRLDPVSGRQQVYATLRDLRPCAQGGDPECSPGTQDFHSWPDYLSFAPDGTLYQTDSLQGLLWRIPKGGGPGEVWFRDPRLATEIGPPAFGPSGLELMPDGRTLMFTTVAQPLGSTVNVASGRIWTLPILPNGRPGQLKSFWESGPVEAPGGIGFGRSGKVYVALTGSNQIAVFSPQGQELQRAPSPAENALLPVPLDSPLGVEFEGERLIVANNSFLTHSPSAWALLDVFAGERGIPEVRPHVGSICTPASGRIARRRLGPTRLGWTRAHVRRTLRGRVARRSIDSFCLQGGGALRVGYPSRWLLRSLSARKRQRVRGRAVLLLTSSRRYSLRQLRVGAASRQVRRQLRSARRLRVGASTWYLASGRRSRLVFRARGGVLREVGIASKSLTRSRRRARGFLKSFR